MNINGHTSFEIIHNYNDDNDYGYFCDPSKPGSPFIKNKYKIRSYSHPSYMNPIKELHEIDEIYEKSTNKIIANHIDKYVRIIIYTIVIISSMTITWILNEYQII
jgi:hypothetical protein